MMVPRRFTPISSYSSKVLRVILSSKGEMIGSPDTCSLCCEEDPVCKCKAAFKTSDMSLSGWSFELKSKLLIVEGNIGVGKTTLTKKLAKALGYRTFLEPATENPFLGENHVLLTPDASACCNNREVLC